MKHLSIYLSSEGQAKQGFNRVLGSPSAQTIEQLQIHGASKQAVNMALSTSRFIDFTGQLPLLTHLEIRSYIDAPSTIDILHNMVMLETLNIHCYLTEMGLDSMDIKGMLQDRTKVNHQLQDLHMVMYHEAYPGRRIMMVFHNRWWKKQIVFFVSFFNGVPL